MRYGRIILVTCAFVLMIVTAGRPQMGPGDGFGMMGGGMMGGEFAWIPEKLPAPESEGWAKRLEDVLGLEKLSKRQYMHDSAKYGAGMPYMMVEPQEEDHVLMIGRLLRAYGISAGNVPVPKVKDSVTLEQAYMIARDLEADLIPRYEWLIARSSDETSARVLGIILFQTRMHYRMFTRSLLMTGY